MRRSQAVEVPFLPYVATVVAAGAVLSLAVFGSGAWGASGSVTPVVEVVVAAAIFYLIFRFRRSGSRPQTPLPRRIPWTRAAMGVVIFSLLFLAAAAVGMLFLVVGGLVGTIVARLFVRRPALLES